jgi:TPR repeat protein
MKLFNLRWILMMGFLVGSVLAEDVFLVELRSKAEAGDAVAQSKLGDIYFNADGVMQDSVEAAKWRLKAAKQGNAYAQLWFGLMCLHGDGVLKDGAEAAKWLSKAANQGITLAQYSIGMIFANGDGVQKDSVQAHAWVNIASANGHAEAKKRLILIEKEMTADQKAEALKLARELFEKISKK